MKKIPFVVATVCLLVAASMVTVVAPANASNHSEFSPVADSYTDFDMPDVNRGLAAILRTGTSPIRNTYIKFDVQGEGTVSSAVLRVWTTNSNSGGFEVRTVADTSWEETTITYNNAPALGPVIATSGPAVAGTFTDVDVSAAVTGDGPVTLALTSPGSQIVYSSQEGLDPPTLFIPGPPSSSPFNITRSGLVYTATSLSTGQVYSGTLKVAVEAAANELDQTGGGDIVFSAGTFDFGSDHFEFDNLTGIRFLGQGIDITILQNDSSEATDTEPFDFSNSVQITIRDMTVIAAGPLRPTSDALDFDGGDDNIVERVKITGSRGRGIVFDGKELSGTGTADNNVVRDCSISNIPGDGIELLASSNNVVENCTITDVGGHGIQLNASSATAEQPNKQSLNNVIRNNIVTNSGLDGVHVNSANATQVLDNTVTNSSDDTPSRDGIQISSVRELSCNDNVIAGNVATDNQPVRTQRYGLNIQSANCNDTVVGLGNDFSGNRVGPILDSGTNTQYLDTSDQTEPDVTFPRGPGGLLYIDPDLEHTVGGTVTDAGSGVDRVEIVAIDLGAAGATGTGQNLQAWTDAGQWAQVADAPILAADLVGDEWSFTWDPTPGGSGSYVIGIRAYDVAGNKWPDTKDWQALVIIGDTTVPTIAADAPVVAGDTITWAGTATEDVAVRKVRMIIRHVETNEYWNGASWIPSQQAATDPSILLQTELSETLGTNPNWSYALTTNRTGRFQTLHWAQNGAYLYSTPADAIALK